VVSPNHEDFLEFLSIKVPDGPLTSRLQHIKPGDRVLVGTKPTGTLLVEDLKPGRNLFLLATGTGLAPFMSIVRDPATYERFDQVVLTHGVRVASELAYRDHILHELPRHEFLGEFVRDKLRYYPTVTREDFEHVGRLTDLLGSGRLLTDLGLPPLDPALDRAMICGSPAMLKDLSALLDAAGFRISPGIGEAGDYVVEKAFAVR
jgi:ferredoxin--NADP+ reductase